MTHQSLASRRYRCCCFLHSWKILIEQADQDDMKVWRKPGGTEECTYSPPTAYWLQALGACSVVFSYVCSFARETPSHCFERCRISRPCRHQNHHHVGGQGCGTNHHPLHSSCYAVGDHGTSLRPQELLEKSHESNRLRWMIQAMTRPVTLIKSRDAYDIPQVEEDEMK